MIRRLEKGKRLRIRAADWNQIAASVESAGTVGGGDIVDSISRVIVYAQNDSGADIDRGEALGIDGPLIAYTENADEYLLRPTVSGIKPVDPDHVGRLVVAIEPISYGAIGRCVIAGVALAQITLAHESHRFAEIEDNSYRLRSGNAGSVAILYAHDLGDGTAWAIVRVGGGGGGAEFELAEVQSVDTNTLVCQWLDEDGAAHGASFTVNVYSYTPDDNTVGQVDLADCYPTPVAGQLIRVYRQPRTEWNGVSFVTGYWAVDRFDEACD